MFKIYQAELRRSFYHRSNLIFIGITIFFSLISTYFSFLAIFDEKEDKALEIYQQQFSFPNNFFYTISISYIFLFLLTPAITAQFIGIDYQLDTWKMILPRTPNRKKLLLSKIANLVTYLVFLSIITGLIITIFGVFGSIWLKTPFIQFSNWHISPEQQSKVIEICVFVAWYISIATILTIVSRSLIVGTFGSFAVYVFCNLIRSYSPEYISIWLAPTHFRNLLPQLETIVPVLESSRPGCSIFVSWVIVLGHILGTLFLSYFFLKNQEFISK